MSVSLLFDIKPVFISNQIFTGQPSKFIKGYFLTGSIQPYQTSFISPEVTLLMFLYSTCMYELINVFYIFCI